MKQPVPLKLESLAPENWALISSYLSGIEITHLMIVNHYFYRIFCQSSVWQLAYVEHCGIDYRSLNKSRIPLEFDWKEAFITRYKCAVVNRFTEIKLCTSRYGNFVGKVVMTRNTRGEAKKPSKKKNRNISMYSKRQRFPLEPGEVIVKITSREGDIIDNICFHTNRGRSIGCGGSGGREVISQGDFLVDCKLSFSSYAGQRVLSNFVPVWFHEPIKKYIIEKTVTTITVGYDRYVNFISLTFSDHSIVSAGAGGKYQSVIKLSEDEYINAIHYRCGTILDAITFQTNKAQYGSFGGKGGGPMITTGERLLNLNILQCEFYGETVIHKIKPEWTIDIEPSKV
jgi:hypothetical protein